MATRLDGEDAAWLHLEDRANPMVVSGLLELDGKLSLARARQVFGRLRAHPRFGARVVEPRLRFGAPAWRAIPGFDFGSHVEEAGIHESDDALFRTWLETTLGSALDPRRPLWCVKLLDRPGGKTTVLFRVHHALADGHALLRVLETLTGAANAARPAPPIPARARWRMVASGAAALGRLALLPADPRTRLREAPHGWKRAAWSRPLALAPLKILARARGATLNDVLVAAVAGALRRHLERLGDEVPERDLRAMVPVDLRGAGEQGMGNHFGLVFLGLPVGEPDALTRIDAVARRTMALKRSAEAPVVRAVLGLLGRVPGSLERTGAAFFGTKASLVLTNLPGPRSPVAIDGIRVRRMTFWVPEAARLGLGVSLFSYAGELTLGVIADANVLPDPVALVDDLEAELAAICPQAMPVEAEPTFA